LDTIATSLGHVFVSTVTAAAFGTNCYLVGTGPGQECVIVDPGIGVQDAVAELLREHRLKPTAVLLTHGHLDHVYAVTPLCGSSLAAHVHEDDRYRLGDPFAQLDPALIAMVEQQFGARGRWAEPERVVGLSDGQSLELAGLRLLVRHAPGHTEGSVLFAAEGVPDGIPDELDRTVLAGDVLFAGSIGRTDLPGGDDAAMQRSLRAVVLPLPDSTLVLPGHGPATTMQRERATNPFLRALA
jgi:glyoxylase-like metal-dependent hydrolase (beta-lactamase superfamily II)